MSMFWPGYNPMGGLAGNLFSQAGISGVSPVVGSNLSASLASIARDPSLLKTIGGSGSSAVVGENMSAPLSSMAGSGMEGALPYVGAGVDLASSLATGDLWKHPLTTTGKIAGGLGGTLGGAALGSMIMPGFGTALGAGVGSGLGGTIGKLPGSIGAK